MPPLAELDCYAVTAPGVETITAGELQALGLVPAGVEPGGVAFRADDVGLARANLHLRTASRVIVRLGSFRASAFYELERRARRLPWEAFVGPGRRVTFRVTSRKSRLYHQDAVAERLARAVTERVPSARPVEEVGERDEERDPEEQLFVVRLFRDECTVSADSSGPLLHRRGYRLATAKAPLRETLAATILLGSGWDGAAPLVDPMCGSGTIVIEAALLARRIPPGLRRRFAFEAWPGHDPARWQRVLKEARAGILERAPGPIHGSDRDAGAIEAARANAERAGVAEDLMLRRAALSAAEPPPGPGWIVTNPPYGLRVGERTGLRDLFAQLGNLARRRYGGWRLAMLSAVRELDAQTRLPLEPVLETSNGGIRVRLLVAPVPSLAGQHP